ncbi:MAG: dockerin type I domain-containing protein [Candidatus Daviesbacteria bacterium]|nr:dockerin type I domain-containing protein [Candidatus Daviesbacteria bacterium]
MGKLNEKGPAYRQAGFIQFVLILLLLVGLGVGLYLVQNRTSLFSKAAPVTPQTPETSFELEAQADTSPTFADVAALKSVSAGQRFRVDIWARSDIDPANLFVAKIKFPTDSLKVVEINKRGSNSFVNQWIADPSFDNSSGDISIIGGVNSPGLLTSTQSSGSVKGVSATPNAKLATSYQGGDLSYLNEGEGKTVPIGYTMFIIADLSDGSALSGQIYISKGDDGKQDFSCPGGYAGNPTTGNSKGEKWCLVGDKKWGAVSMNTSGRLISKAYTFTESGKYNVVVNAYTSTDLKGTGPGDQCSGNPFSGGPSGNSAWSDCGPTSRMIVTVQALSSTSPPVTPPTASINANSATITKGQSVTLTWSSTNSTKCFLMPPGVIKTVDPSGSDSFSPTTTTTYILRCEGVGGAVNSVTASTTVTVPQAPQSQLMVPRLMASIIFEAKKAGNAQIQFTDSSQILRNSDSLNIISAKKGLTLPITSAPAPTSSTNPVSSGQALTCTNIAASLPLGKLPSGEDVYVVTGTKTVQLGINASPLAKMTWKPVDGITFSSLSSNPATITASVNGSFEIRATASWENPVTTADCPPISVSFQPVSQATPTVTTAPVAGQNLRHDGDINGDGKINLTDMSRLLAQFGQSGQSEADLNGDGVVNSLDILKLRSILVKNGML